MLNKICNMQYSNYVLLTILLSSIMILGCHTTPYVQGQRLYVSKCQSCHMEDGRGLASLIPSLQSSPYLGKSELACILKNGIIDTIFKDSTYLIKNMPSFASLSTTEVTNIVNFMNHAWNPGFREISILEIGAALDKCELK